MNVTPEIKEDIQSHRTACQKDFCQNQAQQLEESLIETLASPQVSNFQETGEWFLNGLHWRPVYTITHHDGRTLEIAFTGLSNIMTFSSRDRYTHNRADEFRERMERFLGTQQPAR